MARRLKTKLAAAALAALGSTAAPALPGTFVVDQVYSNASGSVQFVEIYDRGSTDCDAGEHLWKGHYLTSTGPSGPKTFVFPANLPTCATSKKHVLIATQGFADLGLVPPDFVIPNGFLSSTSGQVDFDGQSQVAYTSIPTDGIHALDGFGNPIVNVATNLAGMSVSLKPTDVPVARNYQGLWYKAPAESEAGWGINFAHQGDVIFATWFTYDTSGKALWLTMTAVKTAEGTYAGTLYRTKGPPFSAVPFSPSAVSVTAVGSGTLTFSDADNGSFAYTVNGVSQAKAITRQVFGPVPVCTFAGESDLTKATNYQDLWYAAPAESEAGWGVNFTHQGDVIFATWFTYDEEGVPLWLSATTPKTGAGMYSGTLYRTEGPAFDAVPFLPSKVTATPVGTLTLTFANGNAGTFAYTLNGVTQSKAIVRQVFRPPGTTCR